LEKRNILIAQSGKNCDRWLLCFRRDVLVLYCHLTHWTEAKEHLQQPVLLKSFISRQHPTHSSFTDWCTVQSTTHTWRFCMSLCLHSPVGAPVKIWISFSH
jgi:hypothetical protein